MPDRDSDDRALDRNAKRKTAEERLLGLGKLVKPAKKKTPKKGDGGKE